MGKLPRSERLRGRDRIRDLFETGGRAAVGRVAARALANGTSSSRLAAVAGKGLGNAVKRNRLRRRIRAAFRLQKGDLPKGWDLAILARPGLMEAEWRDVMREVREAAVKATRSAAGRQPSRHRP